MICDLELSHVEPQPLSLSLSLNAIQENGVQTALPFVQPPPPPPPFIKFSRDYGLIEWNIFFIHSFILSLSSYRPFQN